MADDLTVDLTIETHKVFNTNVIELRGDLTSQAETSLKSACRSAAEAAANVLIDLSRVTAMDTSGVGVLMMVIMDVRKQGRKVLVSGITSEYKKVFELVRFSLYAPIFDTEEHALTSIG